MRLAYVVVVVDNVRVCLLSAEFTMSDPVDTALSATDTGLTVSQKCGSEVTTSSCSAEASTPNMIGLVEDCYSSDQRNSSGLAELTSMTDVGYDADLANSSVCNNNTIQDEGMRVSGSVTEKTLGECKHNAETIAGSALLPHLAEKLGSSVSALSSADVPVGGLLQNAEEQCRSDTVTFNLPLEVIGACWFMKRDTETCLQATTSDDGLLLCCCLLLELSRH